MTKEKTSRRPRSKALAAVHETAAGRHRLNIIDAATTREFDAVCLTPVEKLTPDEIRAAHASARRSRSPSSRIISTCPRASSANGSAGTKDPTGPR